MPLPIHADELPLTPSVLDRGVLVAGGTLELCRKFPTTTTPELTNHITNPSLVTWPAGDTPTGWAKYDNGGAGTATWSKVAGGGPLGLNSWRLQVAGRTQNKGFSSSPADPIPGGQTRWYVFWWKGDTLPEISWNGNVASFTWVTRPATDGSWHLYKFRATWNADGGGGTTPGTDLFYVYGSAVSFDVQFARAMWAVSVDDPGTPEDGETDGWAWDGAPNASFSTRPETNAIGTLETIAHVSDMAAGLELKESLTGLSTLSFAIPWDKFVPSQGASQRDLARSWEVSHPDEQSPFPKRELVAEHTYLVYTTPPSATDPGRRYVTRLTSIDREDSGALSGTAACAALELTDYLSHYNPGRNQFTGLVPSTIARRILAADHSIALVNRKFIRDTFIRMNLALEIPDMTPSTDGTTVHAPSPFAIKLPAVNPKDVALFSGIARETIRDDGDPRTLTTGSLGYAGFDDIVNPGHFKAVTSEGSGGLVPGPLDFSSNTVPFVAGETLDNVSRVFYGGIKPSQTGIYSISFEYDDGARIFFRGRQVGDDPIFDSTLYTDTTTLTWQSSLTKDLWYPLVIHKISNNVGSTMKLRWTRPDGVTEIIPAASLTHQLHGGLILVRVSDVTSVIRFLLCFKDAESKGLIIAFPIWSIYPPSATAGPDWPKTLPPGSLIEEYSFPANDPFATVTDWGTGWTRRPGPRTRTLPPVATSRFSGAASGY